MTDLAAKTVWVTRTLPSARDSAAAFESAGYQTVIAPLLEVTPRPLEKAAENNSVLIFTSQNGVRAFCAGEARRDLAVITVGDATAAIARAQGFKDVRSVGGTSNDIAQLVSKSPDKDALYLHLSGQHVRGAVTQDLKAMGLNAERRICYSSEPVTNWPDIEITQVEVVALFSPLAAQTFATLSSKLPLKLNPLTVLSISPATDAALTDLPLRRRCVAASPTLESMIAALQRTG